MVALVAAVAVCYHQTALDDAIHLFAVGLLALLWPLLVLGLMARWVALNLIDPLIAYHTVNVMRTLVERMRSVAAPGAVQQRDSLEEFAQLWKSNREDTLIGGITATGKPYANHAWVYACRRHSSRQPAKALLELQ